MKYARILSAFYSTPLALQPEKIAEIRRFLHAKAAGEKVSRARVREIVANRAGKSSRDFFAAAAKAVRRPDGAIQMGRVAIVPVAGVVSQRCSMMEEASGAVSCERIGAQIDNLVADPSVKTIVMDFDSPGGSVFGVPELGAKIRAARDQKRIIGMANATAASAAYWLISQTSEVNVTPSGWVGSIGVYTAHEDWSKFEEELGVKTTLISAGQYKVEGNPYNPLSDEARAEMQRQVDHYYEEFLAAVAKGRGVSEAKVRSNFGKGRMVLAEEAVQAGMADRVATLEKVLRQAGAYDGGATAESAAPPIAAQAARNLAGYRARLREAE